MSEFISRNKEQTSETEYIAVSYLKSQLEKKNDKCTKLTANNNDKEFTRRTSYFSRKKKQKRPRRKMTI